MKPYPYQLECLDVLSRVRGKGTKKALAVLATGLGKTVVAAFDVRAYLKENPNARILYLAHQNDILTQACETFEEVLGDECSYGFFTGVEKTPHQVTCLFASFQTMKNWREEFARDEFDYIVVDESHHGQAASYRLTLRYFKAAFLLAITATPDRKDLKDIRHLYGAEVFRITLEEALALNYLAAVEYWLLIDEVAAKKLVESPEGRHSIKELNRRLFIPRRDEEIVKVIGEKTSEIRDPKIIVFCSSIRHCENLAVLMPNAAAIHSKLSPNEQKERLKAFKSGALSAIITVDKFNEGVDLPAANVIVFLRATSSLTIFVQQLGRGLRRADGKDKVLVLDFVGNCDRLEQLRNFSRRVFKIRQSHSPSGEDQSGERMDALTLDYPGEFHFTELVQDVLHIIGETRSHIVPPNSYSKADLLDQLQKLKEKLGRVPTIADIKKESQAGTGANPSTFMGHFGSFNQALREAGLELNKVHRYTDDELIEQLRDVARSTGSTPTFDVMEELCRKGKCASGTVFTEHFGSFTNALVKAGFTPNRGMSNSAIIGQLQALSVELGHVPTALEIQAATARKACVSTTTLKQRFGSVEVALVAAGLDRDTEVKQKLIGELQELARRLGRTPKKPDVQEASRRRECGSTTILASRFGSLTAALEAAGLTPTSKQRK